MKILFLGTCAADYSPALKTVFKNCFDKDARRSSSVLLDDRILIDCGEHTLESLFIAKVDIRKITDIVITHFHPDHFKPDSINKILEYSENKIRLWVREDAVTSLIQGVEVVKMTPYVTYSLRDDLKVTGLKSNHDENSFPQILFFEDGEKRLLYALDGAWFVNRTFYWLSDKRLSLLVLDATVGDIVGDYRAAEHNSLPMIRLLIPSPKTICAIFEETKVYLSHIAPSLHKSHTETEKIVENDGLKIAYDGLTVEI